MTEMNNISSNIINKYIPQYIERKGNTGTIQTASDKITFRENMPVDKSVLANPNLPVSYVKIAEINVPGAKNKAVLYKLSNGQQVVLLNKKGPAYIRTSYKTGAADETDDIRGISHFIEHNLFNGSKGLLPGEYDKRSEAVGAEINAYTSFSQTQYHMNLCLTGENDLEEAVKLNATITQYPTFPENEIEREKEPVKSEIDMCKDDISTKTYSINLKKLFNIESDSEDLVIGTKDNINAMNREKLFDYYNKKYTTDNAVTVIVGDIDIDETINLVAKYFNKPLDSVNAAARKRESFVPTNRSYRTDFVQNDSKTAMITLTFPIAEGTSTDELNKIDILSEYISSLNSDISQKLKKYGVYLDFDRDKISSDPDGAGAISANISLPEEHVEEVLDIIYNGLSELATNPPDENDTNTCKEAILHKIKNVSGTDVISEMLVSAVNDNNIYFYDNLVNSAKNTSSKDLSGIASKFFNTSKAAVCIAHASGTTNEKIKNNYNKTASQKIVSFGKSADAFAGLRDDLSKTKQYVLNNNMHLAEVPTDSASDCKLTMKLTSDIRNDVYKTDMLVLSEILNRGSAHKSNAEYVNECEKNHVSALFMATGDTIDISASFPADKSEKAHELIKETLFSPAFTPEEFELSKASVKRMLLNLGKAPKEAMLNYFFPENAEFNTVEEQLKRLDRLTLDDIKKLYGEILSNAQASAVIAAEENEIAPVVNRFFLDFSGVHTFKPFICAKNINADTMRENTEEKTLTAVSDKAQARILQSYKFKYTGNVEDTAKIYLLNRILGGGMSSRLFKDIRNKEKIAYHVSSNIDRHYDTGIFNLETETSSNSDLTAEASVENITKSINSFKKNVERLKTEKVSQEELDNAKKSIKAEILKSYENNSDYSSNLSANINNSPYGVRYDILLADAIDAVTPEDITAAANFVFKNPPATSITASEKNIAALNFT